MCTFQSTLPVKGATERFDSDMGKLIISIHAPCEGSDLCDTREARNKERFQSTLPVKGATARG